MGNNVFYVYIRLRNMPLTELPTFLRKTVTSYLENTAVLAVSVCKEQELEECLTKKVKFWEEAMKSAEAKHIGAELVIHQIQVSNGGLELSYAILGSIAEAGLTLNITHTICKLI